MRLYRMDELEMFWLILSVVCMVASLRYSLDLVVRDMENSAKPLLQIVTVSDETFAVGEHEQQHYPQIFQHYYQANLLSNQTEGRKIVNIGRDIYFLYFGLLFLFESSMPAQGEFTSHQLGQVLEEISKNFAYKMLHFEISLSMGNVSERNRSVQIADLTALYMKAVESLQGRYEQGFVFFHEKIQNLMKRRSVVQELFKSVNSSLSTSEKTMKVISKAEVDQRKEEYDLRMTLQNEKFDHKRVKEMIKTAQMKINMIQSKIKTGIFSQEEALAARIKIRKMKSESSLNGDEAEGVKESPFKKRVQTENSEDDFDYAETAKKARKRSIGKQPNRKLQHLFGSFSGGIKI